MLRQFILCMGNARGGEIIGVLKRGIGAEGAVTVGFGG